MENLFLITQKPQPSLAASMALAVFARHGDQAWVTELAD
jgi:hypothetical protein